MNAVRTNVVAWLGVLATLLCQAPFATAADTVKLSVAATDDPVYLPFFVAIDKGYYRELGLEVEVLYVGGGTATPGLISGSLQFSTSTGSTVSAILRGARLKIVMNLAEQVPWKLWVTRPEIASLADLKGKAVGVQSRGDLFEMSMRTVLMKAGLDGDAVHYLQLGFGSAPRLGVIRTGSLPAVLLTNLEERIARESGMLGQARMLIDMSREIRTPNNGLATSDRLIAGHPTVVERMLRGTLMAVQYIKSHRDGALQILARRAPAISSNVLREALDETARTILDNGMASPAAQQSEIAVRGSIVGLTPQQTPSADTVFDYALVRQAAERLKASQWAPAPTELAPHR